MKKKARSRSLPPQRAPVRRGATRKRGSPQSSAAASLEQRIERLESIEEIRTLVAKYSLSLDMRDLDAHVNLFAPDIRVGRERVGRAHLKAWVDATLRHQFTGTSHHLGGHIIEFTDAAHAHGVVYSKNEHETDDEWVIMQMLYWDEYERLGGRWYFRRRLPCYWYATDLNKPPVGELKMRWPRRERYAGSWHDLWPSWKQFWAAPPAGEPHVAAPAPLGQFLKHMRRGAPDPKIRVR
jgi:SnoaL-like domain